MSLPRMINEAYLLVLNSGGRKLFPSSEYKSAVCLFEDRAEAEKIAGSKLYLQKVFAVYGDGDNLQWRLVEKLYGRMARDSSLRFYSGWVIVQKYRGGGPDKFSKIIGIETMPEAMPFFMEHPEAEESCEKINKKYNSNFMVQMLFVVSVSKATEDKISNALFDLLYPKQLVPEPIVSRIHTGL